MAQDVVSSPQTLPPSLPSRKVPRHRLKPTQEAFIKHYADPTDPAFGNGTEAYAQSHPTNMSRDAAAVGAYNTLRSPKVELAVQERFQAQGFGKAEAIRSE